MKLVLVDVQLSRRQKVVAAAGLAIAVGLVARVGEADVLVFQPNQTLTSADLNGALQGLDGRITQLEAFRVVTASAERTGYVPPGTQVWTSIPGLSTTFTLAAESRVQMQTSGSQRTSPPDTAAVCHAAYRYVVDGTPAGDASHGQRIHVSAFPGAWHSTWSLADFRQLGVGEHTVSVQVRRDTAALDDCAICGEWNGTTPGYTNCTLNVVAVPIPE